MIALTKTGDYKVDKSWIKITSRIYWYKKHPALRRGPSRLLLWLSQPVIDKIDVYGNL